MGLDAQSMGIRNDDSRCIYDYGPNMIISAQNPLKNSMFIWFVVWSSFVHGGIMAYQAIIDSHEMGHFLGVPFRENQ